MELIFADNFETRLFPVLADHYFRAGDYERARKVCEIGLDYYPDNVDGLYILAQTVFKNGDLQRTENLLKTILDTGIVHPKAAKTLVNIQTELQRSEATLFKTWQKILQWEPRNETARQIIQKHVPVISHNKKNIQKEKDNRQNKDEGTINISPRLATFTMVTILKNQGLYHQALHVLEMLEQKGKNVSRIKKEKQELIKLIGS